MPKSVFTDAYQAMCQNLIAMRKGRGVSQTTLAERLGRDQPFISRIERGERRLDVVEFYAVAKALGLEPSSAFALLVQGFPEIVSI